MLIKDDSDYVNISHEVWDLAEWLFLHVGKRLVFAMSHVDLNEFERNLLLVH